MGHVSNLIEDALRPQKECILPLKGYTPWALMRHVSNLIEDALCLQRVHPSPQGIHASTLMGHVSNLIEDALRLQRVHPSPQRIHAMGPHGTCIQSHRGCTPPSKRVHPSPQGIHASPSCGMYPIS